MTDHQEDSHKEVVLYSSLEVVKDAPQVVHGYHNPNKPLPQTPNSYRYKGEKEFVDQVPRYRRRRIAIIAIIVGSLIVIGAVVGGVLGARSKRSRKSEATATLPPSTEPSPKPTGIASLSPLAATAWETGNDFTVRLVYQDEGDFLQSNSFDSVSGKWTKTSNFTKAKAGGPLAVTRFNQSVYGTGDTDMQTELFYLDDSNQIQEWTWNTTSNYGSGGGLSDNSFSGHSESRLATYWPFIYYQDSSGELREIMSNLSDPRAWSSRSTNAIMQVGGGIAVEPDMQKLEALGVWYQRDDESLAQIVRNSSAGPSSLYSNGAPCNDQIPSQAPLASFSIARASDNTQLNTYVLWQDVSARIQIRWLDDSSGWKGPSTFSAFDGADNGTSIACITGFSFFNVWALNDNAQLARCCFQAGGNVREVQLDGTNWKVIGNVPI